METRERALEVIRSRAQDRPFYERLYQGPPEDLTATPLLTPHTLLTSEDSPVRQGQAQNVVPRATGPSDTVAVHRTSDDTAAMAEAFRGYDPMLPEEQPTCVLMDPRQAGTDFAPYMQQYGHGYVIIDPAAADQDAGLLRAADPGAIIGRPDSLTHLTDQIDGISPETIITAGPLTTRQHSLLRDAFPDAGLRQAMGLLEAGFIGMGCTDGPINSYHVPDELYHAEIVDPVTASPVPDGEEGDVVLTTLWDGALALNRYRTGWRGRVLEDCDCDRDGKRIRVTGQAPVGTVRLQTGQVHRSAINDALDRCGLEGPFRLVLETDGAHILIDPGHEYTDTESAQRALSRKLMSRLHITANHTWRQLAGSDHLPDLEVRFGEPGQALVEDRRFPS